MDIVVDAQEKGKLARLSSMVQSIHASGTAHLTSTCPPRESQHMSTNPPTIPTTNPSVLLRPTVWMSFWDKYLAPGDIRNPPRALPSSGTPPKDVSTQTTQAITPKPVRADAATRQRRQDAMLYGGAFFTVLSIFVTRRALRRKLIAASPPTSPHGVPTAAGVGGPAYPPNLTSGPLDAIEALGLATLNVFSLAIFTVGGAMKFFNLADTEDLRNGVRRGVGFDVYGGEAGSEADKEMEEWAKAFLERRKDGPALGVGELKDGILEKLAEIEEKERNRRAEEKGKR